MLTKLNLGCGEFKKDGFINVDLSSVPGVDLCHNLNEFPYPFEDNHFTEIEADHLLEHLEDPFRVMQELYRIAADGCVITLRVPHFSRGFTHPEHKCGFDVSFPLYFNPSFKGGYRGFALKLDKTRLNWFAQQHLKRSVMSGPAFHIAKGLGAITNFFANISPYFCSKTWCFLVGGFDEIEFRFSVEKK